MAGSPQVRKWGRMGRGAPLCDGHCALVGSRGIYSWNLNCIQNSMLRVERTHLNMSQNSALRSLLACLQWRGRSRGSSVPETTSAVPGTNTWASKGGMSPWLAKTKSSAWWARQCLAHPAEGVSLSNSFLLKKWFHNSQVTKQREPGLQSIEVNPL